jgi:hypothetical protein
MNQPLPTPESHAASLSKPSTTRLFLSDLLTPGAIEHHFRDLESPEWAHAAAGAAESYKELGIGGEHASFDAFTSRYAVPVGTPATCLGFYVALFSFARQLSAYAPEELDFFSFVEDRVFLRDPTLALGVSLLPREERLASANTDRSVYRAWGLRCYHQYHLRRASLPSSAVRVPGAIADVEVVLLRSSLTNPNMAWAAKQARIRLA